MTILKNAICSLILGFAFAAFADVKLSELKAPAGFSIEVAVNDVDGARQMALSPSGVLFIGTRDTGKVYAVQKGRVFTLAKGLNSPNGVAFADGDLFVAEIHQILRYRDMEKNIAKPPKPEVVYGKLPKDSHHGWRYIRIGPDGKLYVPVGAPCNNCESKSEYATINRLNLDGSKFETIASGVRNTVGFDWDSKGRLWFSENGRDWMGEDKPPCEMNRLDRVGENFGYPYCHGGNIPDDEFKSRACKEFKAPVQNLGAHVAPLGMRFYKGSLFPPSYNGQIFLAEHGSWNRSKKSGYRVMLLKVKNDVVESYEPFLTGWLNEKTQNVWGRPVDVIVDLDGSLLVSDDFAGVVYRVRYAAPKSR